MARRAMWELRTVAESKRYVASRKTLAQRAGVQARTGACDGRLRAAHAFLQPPYSVRKRQPRRAPLEPSHAMSCASPQPTPCARASRSQTPPFNSLAEPRFTARVHSSASFVTCTSPQPTAWSRNEPTRCLDASLSGSRRTPGLFDLTRLKRLRLQPVPQYATRSAPGCRGSRSG